MGCRGLHERDGAELCAAAHRPRLLVGCAAAVLFAARVAGRGRLHSVRRDRRRRHGHRVPLAGAGRVLVLDEPTDGLDECNTDVVADVLRSFAGAGKTVLFSTTTTSLSGSSSASSTYTPPTKRGAAGTASARQPFGPAVEDGLRATVFLARRLACTRLRFPLSAVRLVPSAVACCGFNGVERKRECAEPRKRLSAQRPLAAAKNGARGYAWPDADISISGFALLRCPRVAPAQSSLPRRHSCAPWRKSLDVAMRLPAVCISLALRERMTWASARSAAVAVSERPWPRPAAPCAALRRAIPAPPRRRTRSPSPEPRRNRR